MSDKDEIFKSLDDKGLLDARSLRLMRTRLKRKLLKERENQKKEILELEKELIAIQLRLDTC